MKHIILLFISFSFLAACSFPWDSKTNNLNDPKEYSCFNCIQKPFTGEPVNLNGTWSGTGSAQIQEQKFENAHCTIQISQLPLGLDVALLIVDQNGQTLFDSSFTGHHIVNNVIIDPRDNANVGSAGSIGFLLQRQPSYLAAIVSSPGVVQLKGSYAVGDSTMDFNAEVHHENVQP